MKTEIMLTMLKDHLMAKHLASMGEEATDDSSDSEL